MNTTVKDVMTTRVIWVSKGATFQELAAALREYRVSAFPVVDDDRKVIGVVSEADMLTKEALIDEPGFVGGILHRRDQAKARGVTAGDLMTTAVVAVRPDDTVEHAARLMYDRGVKRLPVTDENGRLVGIVSRAGSARSCPCSPCAPVIPPLTRRCSSRPGSSPRTASAS